jgi:hypothetical protein
VCQCCISGLSASILEHKRGTRSRVHSGGRTRTCALHPVRLGHGHGSGRFFPLKTEDDGFAAGSFFITCPSLSLGSSPGIPRVAPKGEFTRFGRLGSSVRPRTRSFRVVFAPGEVTRCAFLRPGEMPASARTAELARQLEVANCIHPPRPCVQRTLRP